MSAWFNMEIKHLLFCPLLFLLLSSEGNAQMSLGAISSPASNVIPVKGNQLLLSNPFEFKKATSQGTYYPVFGFKNYPSINHLPGMFCKLEYKLETKSKLAPRFRLGSLAYTEWMEGKGVFPLIIY